MSSRVHHKALSAVFILIASLALLVFAAPAGAEFQVNGSVVVDTTTRLMWMQSDDGVTRNWQQALSYCEGLSLGGHADWRLSNVKELRSLVDEDRSGPAIDPVFSAHSSFYWSGSTHPRYFHLAQGVAFGDGSAYFSDKGDAYYVRCVRSGP